jgi:hypothetical protein
MKKLEEIAELSEDELLGSRGEGRAADGPPAPCGTPRM